VLLATLPEATDTVACVAETVGATLLTTSSKVVVELAPSLSVAVIVTVWLAEAVPDQDETLFSVVDGRPAHRTRNPVPTRLDRNQQVLAVAVSAEHPVTRTVDTAQGTAVYAVVPVRAGAGQPPAALVIAEFTGPAHADVVQVVQVTALASAAALLIAGGISWFVAGRILAPLRQVRRTAESISESDLTRRIDIATDARDDVARLALTFNGMLDRLQSAFAGQRAFLDDAAHELRTPLTVVRGHLELMGDDPAERAETIALVMEEIGRMNRIVDDLLVLAAAEQPDFLTLDEVDLTDLVVGAVARASALAPRRWTVSHAAEAVVVADGQRLTQALVQLAANAVRYTDHGDRLSIGSALHEDQVVLTVQDTGAGIPDRLKTAVFDRFTRGDRRGGNGAGLGLAIVRSIATAHGGTVQVCDTRGGGATFTLSFPARPPGGLGPSAAAVAARHSPARSGPDPRGIPS
jgi:signal transduction histidine kinase